MIDYQRILVIGCGNMAGAMLEGWIASGITPATFTIHDPAPRSCPAGVGVLDRLEEAGRFDAILLGIKPQMLAALAPAISRLADSDTVILSILAGAELVTLQDHFPGAAGWVRIMPNLAAAIGKSPIGLAAEGLTEPGRAAVHALFDRLGSAEWVSEADFDLFTALAGSGPAFVYRFIDTLAQGAVRLGFAPDKALRTATAMVEGAAALAARSDDDPATLADRVASPGGTTRAGLDVLDRDEALLTLMEQTLRAARDRSAEMAREARAARSDPGMRA